MMRHQGLIRSGVGMLFLLILTGSAGAQWTTGAGGAGASLINLDSRVVAVKGYDPVAYFLEGRARKGSRHILERVGNATYHFASRANKITFLRDAPRFQPQFGGFCAASMARGYVEDINPQIFAIYDNRLYLFKDEAGREWFWRNPADTVHRATENYLEKQKQHRRD